MSEPPSDAPGWSGAPPADKPRGWSAEPAAVYGLEQPVRCPACGAEIDQLFVVRLYRAQVNFVSSLPRSGRLLVCPKCRAIVPGELGAVL